MQGIKVISPEDKFRLAERGIRFAKYKELPETQELLEHLQVAAELAREELVDADPEDPKQIRNLQNTVKKFRETVGAIDAFILEGMKHELDLREDSLEP